MKQEKTLHLVLKAKWYRMIESGEKKEEYRDVRSRYFIRKFMRCSSICEAEGACWLCCTNNYTENFTHVCFHYGYTKRKMTFEITDIHVGTGKPEWGAEADRIYFVIKLGKQIQQKTNN